jgi:hypothetical protein
MSENESGRWLRTSATTCFSASLASSVIHSARTTLHRRLLFSASQLREQPFQLGNDVTVEDHRHLLGSIQVSGTGRWFPACSRVVWGGVRQRPPSA